MSDKEKNAEEVEETFSAETNENETTEDSEILEQEENENVQPVSEVEDLKAQLNEMEDKYLRASAEVSNMNNRFRNERETLQKYRSQDLERAVAIEVEGEQNENLKKGVEMTLESLRFAMQEEGIEEISAEGETFDPTLHQAVQTVPATEKHPAETVVQVLQKGYKLYDRVLRASMVVVAQ